MATWIVDARWWARLSKADQDAIEKSAAEIQVLIPELLAKTDDAALAKKLRATPALADDTQRATA